MQNTSTHKFLSMTFDEKMTWKAHIEILKGSINNKINILKTLANKNHGAYLRIISGAYRTTPVNFLYAEGGQYTLSTRRHLHLLKYHISNIEKQKQLVIKKINTKPYKYIYNRKKNFYHLQQQ